ncbi:MAG: hypothetical protein LBH56_02555 [Coriobacteriales bacterium]|jgi:hypothetical protein|nr:hypothetical protein [Coriobacteriales bacterium]
MKVCPHCHATTFEDMPICYGCLQPFDDTSFPILRLGSGGSVPYEVLDAAEAEEPEELWIEEPLEKTKDIVNREPNESFSPTPVPSLGMLLPVRFHVALAGLFAYDIYLCKIEGAELTVGCARDNNIVLPHSESRRHLLRLYYSQGSVWAQSKASTQQAFIDDIPLTGVRSLKCGSVIKIGEASIELIED